MPLISTKPFFVSGSVELGNLAFFSGGKTYTQLTYSYDLTTDAVALGTSMSIARYNNVGTGNRTVGYFMGGVDSNSVYTDLVDKYSFASGSKTPGTLLSDGRNFGSGYGNDDVGIISGGLHPGSVQWDVVADKYTYADDTVTQHNTLRAWIQAAASCGSPTFGLTGGGSNSGSQLYTDKYTYSNNTRTNGTDLGLLRNLFSGASNSTYGMFFGGNPTTTFVDQYTLSNDTRVQGTSLSTGMRYNTSCSSEDVAVVHGRLNNTTVNTTTKYTYATTSFSAGGTFIQSKYSMGSCSNCHGGLA